MDEYIKREEALQQCSRFGDYTAWSISDGIGSIPAADVAPVIHARWEKRGSSWYCTHCGIGYRITCGNIPASRHKYCPNCGAKMDEVEEKK